MSETETKTPTDTTREAWAAWIDASNELGAHVNRLLRAQLNTSVEFVTRTSETLLQASESLRSAGPRAW